MKLDIMNIQEQVNSRLDKMDRRNKHQVSFYALLFLIMTSSQHLPLQYQLLRSLWFWVSYQYQFFVENLLTFGAFRYFSFLANQSQIIWKCNLNFCLNQLDKLALFRFVLQVIFSYFGQIRVLDLLNQERTKAERKNMTYKMEQRLAQGREETLMTQVWIPT